MPLENPFDAPLAIPKATPPHAQEQGDMQAELLPDHAVIQA